MILSLLAACNFGLNSSAEPTPIPRPTVALETEPTATEIKPIESQPAEASTLDTPVIAYNEIKEGQLTSPDEVEEWVFNGQAGERVNIVLNSQFDSYLELYAPDGEFVASNDDSGENLSAALFDLQLKKSGPHTVLVRGYDGATGGYVLALTGGHPTIGGGTLASGDSRAVLLSEEGFKWQYQGQAGTYLTLTLNADEIVDSYLSLYGPDGTLLTSDDDSGGSLNAEIFEFELPVDGVYTIRANTIAEPGLVTLNLTSSSQTSGGGPLTVGVPQTATLKPERTHQWSFAGESGQIINLSMNSTDFDTFLELRNSQDVILAENDDNNRDGTTNSLIDLFLIPAADTYTIVARGLGEADSGDYNITLELVEVLPGGGPLLPDTPTQAPLASGQIDSWVFEAEQNSFIRVEVESDQFDTYLELYGPDEALLTEDDDSGGNLNPALFDFPVTQAGEYRLVVRSAQGDGGEGGVYDILLSISETLASTGELISGQSQTSNLSSDEEHIWTFEAIEGSSITVRMESTTLDTYLSLYDSTGELLTLNDDFEGTNAVIDNFTIPRDGEYRVVARAYSADEEGNYTILLEITE